jgi:hypothetical protein
MAFGQETRSGLLAAEQAEKATHLAPYKAHWAEQRLLTVRKTIVEQPSGLFPYFDSVFSGGGFTLGAGYRRFTGDRTDISVAGLYSAKGYKLIEASTLSLGHGSGRLDVRARAGWRDATQVAYHGLGVDSPAEQAAAFRLQQSYAGADLTARPHQLLLLTAGATYEGYSLKDPTGSATSVEDAFTAETAPGLGVSPAYVHTTTSAAFDWRPAADYARRGGLYTVAHHRYIDNDSTYSFERLEADLVQHIPILRENWVISLHGRLETTPDGEDQVLYFLLPSLGSGSTLRGYSSWRFRDRHAVLLSGEWRWIANRLALDMAFFYDAGMVAPRLDAIRLGSLVSDYGVGARFHGPARTPLRIELARGREGARLVFAASAPF